MTYYVTAYEKTRAKLIVKEARFTGVKAANDAEYIADIWRTMGYETAIKSEA